MAYVTPIYGGSAALIDYRLAIGQQGQHGCGSDTQFRYRADARERPLRWIGGGLPEFGVDGFTARAELTAEQHDMARALMAGKHPVTGEQLVAPKLAVPADAKVPLGPLVAAMRVLAAERGVDDPVDCSPRRSSGRGGTPPCARSPGAALLRIADALALAETAGLEAEQVWSEVDLLATYRNLHQPAPVVDEYGARRMGGEGSARRAREVVGQVAPGTCAGATVDITAW